MIAEEEKTSVAIAVSQNDFRWGDEGSVLDRLFTNGSSFSFYQAVRILSILYADDKKSPKYDPMPVRFSSRMGWDFPGADVHRISPPNREEFLPQVQVNFIGLAGANGPLPAVYTEQLLRDRKSALRDFLDIFNHRLILLVYRIHEMHHPELTSGLPDQSLTANHLYACFGLGRDPDAATRNRLALPDRALLDYSGLLAHRPHTASGLQVLLSHYFRIEVAVEQFTGAWFDLSVEQWTLLGTSQGRNQRLGDGAILGRRVWDQHAGVTIRLRSLDLKTFESFLPGGRAYDSLQSLTRFYLGEEVDFSFVLELRTEEMPWAGLSSMGPTPSSSRRPELGRLAWLRSPNTTRLDEAAPDAVAIGGNR